MDFDPQGSREPRPLLVRVTVKFIWFRSTRLSRASTAQAVNVIRMNQGFRSTRLSRASTCSCRTSLESSFDFDPQGSREPRRYNPWRWQSDKNFDPQGSREPRRGGASHESQLWRFRSTRLSRASTPLPRKCQPMAYFDPQGSREPRQQKCTIILASMPHLHASYYTSSTNRLSSWNFLA